MYERDYSRIFCIKFDVELFVSNGTVIKEYKVHDVCDVPIAGR